MSELKIFEVRDVKEHNTISQRSTDTGTMSDSKRSSLQLNNHPPSDQLATGSPIGELSFVTSSVTANYSSMETLSKPETEMEKGTVTFTVTKMSTVSERVYSPVYTIGNLPWKLSVSTECSARTKNRKCLSLDLCCNSESESTLWSCEASVKFRLLSSAVKPYVQGLSGTFKYSDSIRGIPDFLEWNKVVDLHSGYVKNDKAMIEVVITIKRVVGVRASSRYNFLSFNLIGKHSAVVLRIDGEQVCVCKHYLSIYSPVFEAMFFADFIERHKREIIMEDIVLDEFLELLHVIYPSRKPVTEDNVEYLLKLSDRFAIPFVTNACEDFLLATDKITRTKKLLWADQYWLASLHDVCIKTFKSCEAVKALKALDEYNQFSSKAKVALLERMFSLL